MNTVKITQTELKTAIDEIAKKNGWRTTPNDIVMEASNPDHILHGEFDWDDKSAAHKQRLAHAAYLMRVIEYTGEDVQARPVTAVGYIYDRPNKVHIPLSVIEHDKVEAHALMLRELEACEGHIRRAQRIADVLHLRDELDELLHKCIGIRQKAMKPSPKSKRRA